MRVVRLVNYIAPASGGLRTALRELGAGYLAAGHEPVLVMPGPRLERRQTEQGLVVTVPGLRVPGTGRYRAIVARRPLRRLLDDLEPDRLEVSDRTTLRWTGAWARRCGVRSMMVSHDSLAALVGMFRPPGLPVRRLVDRLNRNTAGSFDVVVCTTGWAGQEFRRLGVPNLVQVPLGVDLAGFHPARADENLRSGWPLAAGGCWCTAAGSPRKSARNVPSAPWPNCAAAECPLPWSSRETGRGAGRCRTRRPGCRSGSWGTWPIADRWRGCSRPRTW